MAKVINMIVDFIDTFFLYGWRLRFLPRRRFKRIFGFVPSKGGRIRKLEQEIVEKRLGRMALEFDVFCQKEENIYYRTNPYGEGVDPLTVRKQILELRPQIETAKRDFWQAHGLAGMFGFAVKDEVGDYVNEHERRHQLRDVGLDPLELVP